MRSHSARADRKGSVISAVPKHGSEHGKVKLDAIESDLPLAHPNPPKYNYYSAAPFGVANGVWLYWHSAAAPQGFKSTDVTFLRLLCFNTWTTADQGCRLDYRKSSVLGFFVLVLWVRIFCILDNNTELPSIQFWGAARQKQETYLKIDKNMFVLLNWNERFVESNSNMSLLAIFCCSELFCLIN